MLTDIFNIPTQVLNCTDFSTKKIQLSVLRLDEVHPVISGNKIFKLHFYLQAALEKKHHSIITFGGAYSNHLAATAYACKLAGLKSIGIVRGEQAATLSHTLQFCIQQGMQLQFVSRAAYDEKDTESFIHELQQQHSHCTIIPEGGYGIEGASGAALIHKLIKVQEYTHICIAAGTATTTAGILKGCHNETVVCVPVLKGMADIENRITHCTNGVLKNKQLQIFADYHFGGYAKKTPQLISFMNTMWQQHQLPTDFVYTAKMMYAITDKINQGWFAPGSNILCLHTGGLQGNLSLPAGTLLY
jgi:1-aminocyclopropane-1-carboxylate deaminase